MKAIFKNNILEVMEIDTKLNTSKYEVNFLGYKTTYHCPFESIQKVIDKRIKAYDLIPNGSVIIPKNAVGLTRGLLIGGILEDSLYPVYGLSDNELRNYSCSVFFLPNKEETKKFTDYSSVRGFNTKGEQQ